MQKHELIELRKKLPRGSYKLISKKLSGKYTSGTIRQMINGNRTIQPAVVQVAYEIIEFFNQKHKNDENH
jgi:hypothetical protein